MDRFYGFDLGDAESAVSRITKEEQEAPEVLEIAGVRSFITAYARLTSGDLLIGKSACLTPDAVERKLRFKSRFLTDPSSRKDITAFAAGVLGELYANGNLIKGEDCCFYIGCPAGWDRNAREQYREIFEKVGYPPAKIVSESRAALIAACQSRHLQVGYDILSKPVLVVDIGSSTTDFAYICGGKEQEVGVAGEVFLGGGIMDEILLEEALAAAKDEAKIRKVLAESEPWRSYCEFAARSLKEKYFSDEEYWKENPCRETVTIHYRMPQKLVLRMDETIADRLLNRKSPKLGNRSFREVFTESLENVRKSISGPEPELLFLTGGVSRLPAIREWCARAFPDAVIITGAEPEFSVTRGLAWCGRIDERIREFRAEIEELRQSRTVENIVEKHINELYHEAVDSLVEPILANAAVPVFERWRQDEIRRLSDIDREMQDEIEKYLRSDEARELLVKPIQKWLKTVAADLEDYTQPICVRHGVPYTALSLTSYLSISEIDIHIDAKNVFAMEEMTWLIDTIISIMVGLLCGGSGVAIVSSGLPGIIAGVVVSFLILILGKDRIQGAVMNADIPRVARKLVPRSYFTNRMKSVSAEVKKNFYESLSEDKNEAITERLVDDISAQIEQCLARMAEIVEIPLQG